MKRELLRKTPETPEKTEYDTQKLLDIVEWNLSNQHLQIEPITINQIMKPKPILTEQIEET